MSDKTEDFYKKLKEKLEESTTWPNLYLYKFIIPKDPDQSSKLLAIFDDMGAVVETKESKTGKFVSYSIKVRMDNPQHIIDKYKKVGKSIKGVISL